MKKIKSQQIKSLSMNNQFDQFLQNSSLMSLSALVINILNNFNPQYNSQHFNTINLINQNQEIFIFGMTLMKTSSNTSIRTSGSSSNQAECPKIMEMCPIFKFTFLKNEQSQYIFSILATLIEQATILSQFERDNNKIIQMLPYLIQYHRCLKLNKQVLFQAKNLLIIIHNYLFQPYPIQLVCLVALQLCQKINCAKKFKLSTWKQKLGINCNLFQIEEMESQILYLLGFEIPTVTSLEFSLAISNELTLNKKTIYLIRYLLQLSFFINFKSRAPQQVLVSICCVNLACYFLQPQDPNKMKSLFNSFDIDEQQLQTNCDKIFQVLLSANDESQPWNIVYRKFSKSCYNKIALLQFFSSQKIRKSIQLNSSLNFLIPQEMGLKNEVDDQQFILQVEQSQIEGYTL